MRQGHANCLHTVPIMIHVNDMVDDHWSYYAVIWHYDIMSCCTAYYLDLPDFDILRANDKPFMIKKFIERHFSADTLIATKVCGRVKR